MALFRDIIEHPNYLTAKFFMQRTKEKKKKKKKRKKKKKKKNESSNFGMKRRN